MMSREDYDFIKVRVNDRSDHAHINNQPHKATRAMRCSTTLHYSYQAAAE